MAMNAHKRHRRLIPAIVMVALLTGSAAMMIPGTNPGPASPVDAIDLASFAGPQPMEPPATMPALVVKNTGQAAAEVLYQAATGPWAVDFIGTGFRYALPESPADFIEVEFVDPAPSMQLQPVGETPVRVSYIHGRSADNWQLDQATHDGVLFQGVWPGIDARVTLTDGQLKYEFHVAPGADPSAIQWKVHGTDSLQLDAAGNLVMGVGSASVQDAAPTSFTRDSRGRENAVESSFEIEPESHLVGFDLGPYDSTKPLIIDPEITYATYLGGSVSEIIYDAKHYGGSIYFTGYSNSRNFDKVGAGTWQHSYKTMTLAEATAEEAAWQGTPENRLTEPHPNRDVMVGRFAIGPTGAMTLDWLTFVGGRSDYYATNSPPSCTALPNDPNVLEPEEGYGIAIDSLGVYVTGYTHSVDFPVTEDTAYQTCLHSTHASEVTPVSGRPETSHDFYDGFVIRLNHIGDDLLYGTYLGGENEDYLVDIDVDDARPGTVAVVGWTFSRGALAAHAPYPTTDNVYLNQRHDHAIINNDDSCRPGPREEQPQERGPDRCPPGMKTADGVISLVDTTASEEDSLVYSTFIGANGHIPAHPDGNYGAKQIPTNEEMGEDHIWAVDLHDGIIHFAGATKSITFPIVNGFWWNGHDRANYDTTILSNYIAFYGKLDPSVPGPAGLIYSTHLTFRSFSYGLSVDSSYAYVVGYKAVNATGGMNEHIRQPADWNDGDNGLNGAGHAAAYDAWVAIVKHDEPDPDDQLIYATGFGGCFSDRAYDVERYGDLVHLVGFQMPGFQTPGEPSACDDTDPLDAGDSYEYPTTTQSMSCTGQGPPIPGGPNGTRGNELASVAVVTTLRHDRTTSPESVTVLYSDRFGGTMQGGHTFAHASTVDDDGRLYLVGRTSSKDADGFPITPGAYQSSHGGTFDGFVMQVEMSNLPASDTLCPASLITVWPEP